MNNWHGLCKIISLEHIRNNQIIAKEKNIRNMLHTEGESFLLESCFTNPAAIPSYYYFGLDARITPAIGDTMSTLFNEPSGNGYSRVAMSSNGSPPNYFEIEQVDGVYRATSTLLVFSATLSGYGPVRNVFLSTTANNSGKLIATNALSEPYTLAAGDAVRIKMSLALQDNT